MQTYKAPKGRIVRHLSAKSLGGFVQVKFPLGGSDFVGRSASDGVSSRHLGAWLQGEYQLRDEIEENEK